MPFGLKIVSKLWSAWVCEAMIAESSVAQEYARSIMRSPQLRSQVCSPLSLSLRCWCSEEQSNDYRTAGEQRQFAHNPRFFQTVVCQRPGKGMLTRSRPKT